MGAFDVNASRNRVPKWAGRTSKAWAGCLASVGAFLGGLASIPPIADTLNNFFHNGWFSVAARILAIAIAFIGAVWILLANLKEKDEIEVLRQALTKAESLGVSHAATGFRDAVRSIVDYNAAGWTPENVTRFQPEALKFGKSLFDFMGIAEARVCLYEPGAGEATPEEPSGANITALNYVWATPVLERHDPRPRIMRSPETKHMFDALTSKKPLHNRKRKRSKGSGDVSKKWKSSICLGVRKGNESVALLTVDSTTERAFDAAAEGVLILLGDLLAFSEIEKDRERKARIAQHVPSQAKHVPRTLVINPPEVNIDV